MKLEIYDNANRFSDDVLDLLLPYEIHNNLIIANCIRGKEGADTSKWFMAAIKDKKGAIQLVALMTPPHNLIIYEIDNLPNKEAVELLINEIESLKINIPGVISEKSLAARFSESYASLSGRNITDGKKMRIYKLDKLNDIPNVSGRLRPAGQNDLFYLPYWNNAFHLDCGMNASPILNVMERIDSNLISKKNLFIWEDVIPVSQAAMGRRTLNGAVVSAVYTPPHYRGRGYATSCVAGLSQHLLERGYRFCSLFTDLANPISNSIYMKIGYMPVCDYDEYRFEESKG